VQEIINIEPQLGITSTSYCYGKYESSDDEDDHHINRVGVEEEDVEDGDGRDDELIEVINHYMTPPAFGFEVVSAGDQYRCNDWANSGRHSGLSIDELEVEKKLEINLNVLMQ
jgi:hypothetical protein